MAAAVAFPASADASYVTWPSTARPGSWHCSPIRTARTAGSRSRAGWWTGSTAGRAREQELSLRKGLVDRAATALLEACGDAVLTGATRTDANDLVIIGVS